MFYQIWARIRTDDRSEDFIVIEEWRGTRNMGMDIARELVWNDSLKLIDVWCKEISSPALTF